MSDAAYERVGGTGGTVRVESTDLEEGKHSRYRPIVKLGSGGMADVYLVVARGLSDFQKLLVMKQLKPDLSDDPSSVRMFLEEARLSGRLSHRNVVQVYDFGRFGPSPAIIMDYLDGVSGAELWNAALTTECWKPGVGLAVLSEALVGLHYAHELTDFDGVHLGLVHRDFNPKNIFLTYDGEVKVLDFGIAKAFGHTAQTQTQGFRGTVRYIAPEVLRQRTIDRRADIYAAGIMLWESVVGACIWPQDAADVDVLRRIAEGRLPPLPVVDGVSDELAEIFTRATAIEPDDRFATAEEMREALEAVRCADRFQISLPSVASLAKRLFATRRRRIRTVIQKHLGASSSTPPPNLGSGDIDPSTWDKEISIGPSPVHVPRVGSPMRSAWWTLVFAALLGANLMALWRLSRSRPAAESELIPIAGPVSPTAGGPASSAKLTEPQAVPAPREVTVTVTARPAHAELRLDQEILPSNPAVLRPRYCDDVREISATADGFEPRTIRVAFVRDLDLELELIRSKPEPAPELSSPPAPPRKPKAKAKPSRAPAVSTSKTPRGAKRKIFRSIDWQSSTPRSGAKKLQPAPYGDK